MAKYEKTDVPLFKGKKALVLSGAMFGDCVILMAKAGFTKAWTVEEADVVVFTGGADVSPSLYGEKAISGVYSNDRRDEYEQKIYELCIKHNKTMFGICRGAQFLHVMNGGKLWQHVDSHAGRPHEMVDVHTGQTLEVTSLHHQMLKMNEEMLLIGTTDVQVAKTFKSENLFVNVGYNKEKPSYEMEVEAGAYLKTKCFFVQGHPEIGSPEYQSWTMHQLFEFMGFAEATPRSSDSQEMMENIKNTMAKEKKT